VGGAELSGKRVTVVGLARSGVAAARLCAREGAAVTVTDRRAEAELEAPLRALPGGVRRRLGGHDLADFEGADLVVVSPGVPMANPEIEAARRRGVPVWGEVELGFRLLAPGATVVGITGTNGKSTTTALTGALLQADRPTFVGGNLGTPLCEHLLAGDRAAAVVLELSSFQLEGIERFHAHVGAVLNVTPDHLDRYPGVEAYAAAKARLFAAQQPEDFAIANGRDPRALAMASASRGDLYEFGFGPPADGAARDPGGEPGPGGGEIWFTRRSRGPERFLLRNRALRGRHNRENAMAAALCARLLGVAGERVQAGLDAFQGLPHRLELVRERDGVRYVNDSKATNVASTLVALESFDTPIRLILGGQGKGEDYTPLRAPVAERCAGVYLIGEEAERLAAVVGGERCGTLERAVDAAASAARPGEIVLLSPACASFDQFEDYEARGRTFKELVAARRT
jgi:UDP-N-acetylmuramoylalanine--D-glutamate ligase